jgi:hypothetical protein
MVMGNKLGASNMFLIWYGIIIHKFIILPFPLKAPLDAWLLCTLASGLKAE